MDDDEAGDGDEDEAIEGGHHVAGNAGRSVGDRAEGEHDETESEECEAGQVQGVHLVYEKVTTGTAGRGMYRCPSAAPTDAWRPPRSYLRVVEMLKP